MEMHQLRYFLSVASVGGFTKAAKECAVSQPSLSLALKKLEDELGGALFERGRKAARLTERGRLFLPRAQQALEALNRGVAEQAELSGLSRGSVALGCMPTTGAHVLPPLLAAFRGRHPGVAVTLREENSLGLADLLERGEVDLAIMDEAGLRPALEGERLLQDPLVLAVPPGHRLARGRAVPLKALEGEGVIMMKQGQGFRQIAQRAFERAGVRPNVVFESGEIQVVQALAAAGLGVALVPLMVAAHGPGAPVLVRLARPEPSRTLYLARRRRAPLSEAGRALRAVCLETLRKEAS